MLKELRTLLAVAEQGTITAAARRIGLTQAAASAQIQRLEESLDKELLDRSGRQVRLNAAGIDVVSRAEHILHLCDELRDVPQRPKLRAHLRLGAIQSMHRRYLPAMIKELIHWHSEVSMHIEMGGSLPLLSAVEQEELDAALVVRPFFALPTELAFVPLLREPFTVLCPASETSNDWRQVLTSWPFIRYDSKSFGGRVVDRFLQAHHISPRCQVESQDVDAILEFVASGIGVSLVPSREPSNHEDKLRAISLGDETIYREIGIVLLADRRKDQLMQELLQSAQKTMRVSPFAHPLLENF